MRTRQEILSDTIKDKAPAGSYDITATTHERLTIEVLVDIRDILATNVKTALQMLWDAHQTKGGEDNDKD